MYLKLVKPFLDFNLATLILLSLSPVLIIIIVLLSIANKGYPFFFQLRPGKDEKVFKLIKFKTMNDKRDEKGELLSDSERITKIGRIIRKTSLDEFPQLINVLKGDMSLIGPRPLLIDYLALYNQAQKKRHLIKPGITGWAQVNGRNNISWTQKFEYDIWYVENISLKLDLRIALLTLKKVLKSEGINSSPTTTMEKFTGN
ncbi:sugar transferase [Emticicia sp. C21]|uniref:sugar transferase n=1 Tax=Emticicia sp. C21 TaxID=2302915 RepID=UPI000E340B67|nr:sugar transferase [Emticicia sp. C21]RFS17231.1 sugar transferase [Emticicia sp. C21]